MQNLRNENANLLKENIELKAENNFLRNELKGVDHRNTPTTFEKINIEIERRSKAWVWYRDRVLAPTLANVHTLIIMAILFLAFRGTIP